MILETQEEIHQWLKKQCPVYVRWLGDDLDWLIDYVLKRRIGVSDLTSCLIKERRGTLVDLTHLSHGRRMTGREWPYHGFICNMFGRWRKDQSEFVIYFLNQENNVETVRFREEDGKEDFEKTVDFYSVPTTLDTSFYERRMSEESERDIRKMFKRLHLRFYKRKPPEKKKKKRHRRGVRF